MTKRLLTVAFLILLFSPSKAPAAESLNGHDWKELSPNTRAVYMLGFIGGYINGRMQGIMQEGISEGLRWVGEELCKGKQESVCAKLRDVNAGKSKMSGLRFTVIGFKESIGYYVKELDAFYETFPMCRGKRVSYILDQLVKVWASPKIEDTSYEKVGTECVKGG
jgi:hypothetical protein